MSESLRRMVLMAMLTQCDLQVGGQVTATVLIFVQNRFNKFYNSEQQCLMKGRERLSLSFLCCGDAEVRRDALYSDFPSVSESHVCCFCVFLAGFCLTLHFL